MLDIMSLLNADPTQISQWANTMAMQMPAPSLGGEMAGVGMPQAPADTSAWDKMVNPQQGAPFAADPLMPQAPPGQPMVGLTAEQAMQLGKQNAPQQQQMPHNPGIRTTPPITLNPLTLPQGPTQQRLSLAQILGR